MNIIDILKDYWWVLKFDIYLHAHHLEHTHYLYPDGHLIIRKKLPAKSL